MKTFVKIPPLNIEPRIGSMFNNVFRIMLQTDLTDERQSAGTVWDWAGCAFLNPFYLAALSVIKNRTDRNVELVGLTPCLARYLDVIRFSEPLRAEGANDGLGEYKGKTYFPICAFSPKNENAVMRVQQAIQTALKNRLKGRPNIHQALSLLLGEIIDNITDHANSPIAYAFCQYKPSDNKIYLFIADAGRSIYSSFATDDRYSSIITDEESSALQLALQGRSTKNRPEAENRGYGISKSRKLIVNGLGGSFFVLSGNAFFRHDSDNEVVVDLPQDIRWDGTVVLMEIPLQKIDNLNIYDYIS